MTPPSVSFSRLVVILIPCYHPLKGFQIGVNPSGKPKYKIVSYEVHHIEDDGKGHFIPVSDSFLSPYRKRAILDYVTIPCGQCVGCRLEYSRQWANRCLLELEYHDSAYFVTLTYDDLHVPRSYYGDPESGEALPSLTLCKRDFQLFMKRLRKAFPDDNIRFFACGEYGSETFRPHYHAIIFGLHLDDLEVYKKSPDGFVYYNSPSLQRCWSVIETKLSNDGTSYKEAVPLGYAVVANVSWETCAYTARYVMKKLKGPEAEFYDRFNIEPPWTLMSRKPGIARQWYDEHPDCYEFDSINVATPSGGKKFRPPKYFDKLFDVDNPVKSAEVKALRRKLAEEMKASKMSRTSVSYLELLQIEENAKLDSIKKLKRSEI